MVSQHIVTQEFNQRVVDEHYPVTGVDGRSGAAARLLLLELGCETCLIDVYLVLGCDQPREVNRKAVGIVKFENNFPGNGRTIINRQVVAGCNLTFSRVFHDIIHPPQAFFHRPEESLFFFFHHSSDEFDLLMQFGKNMVELVGQDGHQLEQQRLFVIQIGIIIAHGASQDTADDVARLGIRWQLAVGDRKGDRTNMIGDDAESDVLSAVSCRISLFHQLFHDSDGAGEEIGIVVGMFPLQHPDQPLETHTGIHVFGGQWLEAAVFKASKLYKHVVPYLDNLGMVFIYE